MARGHSAALLQLPFKGLAALGCSLQPVGSENARGVQDILGFTECEGVATKAAKVVLADVATDHPRALEESNW